MLLVIFALIGTSVSDISFIFFIWTTIFNSDLPSSNFASLTGVAKNSKVFSLNFAEFSTYVISTFSYSLTFIKYLLSLFNKFSPLKRFFKILSKSASVCASA